MVVQAKSNYKGGKSPHQRCHAYTRWGTWWTVRSQMPWTQNEWVVLGRGSCSFERGLARKKGLDNTIDRKKIQEFITRNGFTDVLECGVKDKQLVLRIGVYFEKSSQSDYAAKMQWKSDKKPPRPLDNELKNFRKDRKDFLETKKTILPTTCRPTSRPTHHHASRPTRLHISRIPLDHRCHHRRHPPCCILISSLPSQKSSNLQILWTAPLFLNRASCWQWPKRSSSRPATKPAGRATRKKDESRRWQETKSS